MSFKIAMTDAEVKLLTAFLKKADHYLEFGSGGSTVLAADFCRNITSIDSSPKWLEKVRAGVAEKKHQPTLNTVYIDIGPTKEWGFPKQKDPVKFENYSRAADGLYHDADFVLVDGRFRVACFSRICAQGYKGPIAIHDYSNRDWYHVVETVARPIAAVDNLTVFLPTKKRAARKLWRDYKGDAR